ncbi:MAG: EthD family reductase [Chloroflexota bacterium]
MITRFWLAPRRPGQSIEDSQRHWRTVHGPMARALTGLRAYVQNHAVLRDGAPLLPHPGFDICSELDFDDVASMNAGLHAPDPGQELDRDEKLMADSTKAHFFVGQRRVSIQSQAGTDEARLLTFLRLTRGASGTTFEAAFLGAYATAVAAARPVRHEQFLSAMDGAACDAVDVITFDSPDATLRYALSSTAGDARIHLSQHILGTERVIVQAVRIV